MTAFSLSPGRRVGALTQAGIEGAADEPTTVIFSGAELATSVETVVYPMALNDGNARAIVRAGLRRILEENLVEVPREIIGRGGRVEGKARDRMDIVLLQGAGDIDDDVGDVRPEGVCNAAGAVVLTSSVGKRAAAAAQSSQAAAGGKRWPDRKAHAPGEW